MLQSSETGASAGYYEEKIHWAEERWRELEMERTRQYGDEV